ncbi:hypothetical protein Patl1_09277 [Pistacia atlantica]|uniref:Uncharacterized protein n=1 Tax=Pistacia atlantica TaxID=434234 RepID=A0ACC1ACJ9_9ROSI|nr:hypothetical protein Patl1_09277 [Pistacia atlantica]
MVRLFLSEESPSQVGLGAQEHLQAKSSWPMHSNGVVSDEFLPPGFEGAHPPNQLQIKLSEIPLIKWRCPPRFRLDLNWQVVAGDESKEVEIQNQREMRVLEAVYPRPSAIPPNPSVSVDIECADYNDQQTPLIPITPIEDEEAAADTPSGSVAPFNVSMSSQPPLLPPGIPAPPPGNILGVLNTAVNEKPAASGMALGVDPEVVAAASAALNEMTKSNEHLPPNCRIYPSQLCPPVSLSDHPPVPPVPLTDRPPFRVNMMETSSPSIVATSSGAFYTQPNGVGVGHPPNAWVKPPPGVIPSSSSASCGVSQTKDMNYYKNLIQQHGGERQEIPQTQQFGSRYIHHSGTNQELINNPKSRDSKPKIMKPCIYFNSSRGCRHGANCAYQHDTSSQQRGSNIPEMQNAKRMKMDREISS